MAERPRSIRRNTNSDTLADILERVLETGIVIAGDIRVNLNDVELLTIQIRLIVCSVDKAEQMGMDWWKNASYLTSDAPQRELSEGTEGGRSTADVLASLDRRLERLEKRLDAPADSPRPPDAGDNSSSDADDDAGNE
jgi:hypothetical protein